MLKRKSSLKRDTTKRFPTDARILTSREGKKEAVADAVKKAAKEKAEAERKKKKQNTGWEDILHCNNRDLTDIAFSLDIETDSASLNVLRVCLKAYFNANPSLKQTPQYIGPFSWKCKRNDSPKENTDPGPSSTCPRLSSPPTPGSSHHSPSPILHFTQPSSYQFPNPVQPRPVPRPIPHLSHDPANKARARDLVGDNLLGFVGEANAVTARSQ
ncbi:hypothetical protein BT96DRAFT_1012644 [Gymnopus androsaceus JB14]|uniref:Uncharacterized protein n=1 Tax=Gymnopus androsaceus JB14 TaxID=1447944 RepID=A0A6A4IMR2_9AGAR|nr:hypothetical protein BT96DRAFT_1012644 [Gymnopus androsaceus JB14]